MATKAKKQEVAVDPMASIMAMMQAQQEQIKTLSAALAQFAPGNAMLTVPAGIVEKKPQGKEVEMIQCNLETGTDPGYPYMALLFADGARKFIDNDDARMKVSFGAKRKVAKQGQQDIYRNVMFLNFKGGLPKGSVVELQGGYGKEYYAITAKGPVQLEGYERAMAVLQGAIVELK